MIRYNRGLKNISRVLRKNMTRSEILLWSKIRRKQLKGKQFYRQKIIGNYIVDFCCMSCRLVVEVDGEQHFTPPGIEQDIARDHELENMGFRIMRFPSAEVLMNIDGVVSEIYESLESDDVK